MALVSDINKATYLRPLETSRYSDPATIGLCLTGCLLSGVGKSRTLSGLVWENFLHGRKKAIWFTASPFLAESIRKDFTAVGVNKHMAIHSLGEFHSAHILPAKPCLLIVSYGIFRSKGRYEQIKQWLGDDWDGLAALDESHK